MNNTIYLLPGRGGRLDKGLGQALISRGYNVVGREIIGEFQRLSFQEQIDLVVHDLKSAFWHGNARIIGNSFGAYLFLHAQTLLEPFVGRVLLLSPIVGMASNEADMMFFVPPRAHRLQELSDRGEYPTPSYCEIHVGEDDWQSNPANVAAFAEPLGIKVNVVPKMGHRLDSGYVESILDTWLEGPLPIASVEH